MVTLNEVKAFLGVTDTNGDSQLQAILDSVNDEIIIAIGDISYGEKEMTIKNSAVKNNTITLNIINPVKITEINGNDFSSKVAGTDYLIKYDGEAIIKDLSLYNSNDFGFFSVKFNAGFENMPKSLISLVSNYVGYLYSQDMGKDISQEQLGPRLVTYSGNSGNSDEISPARQRFKQGLSAFIPLSLKIY